MAISGKMASFVHRFETLSRAMFGSGSSLARPLVPALASLAFAAATGVAFAGRVEHAPDIFPALVEAGFAWCF